MNVTANRAGRPLAQQEAWELFRKTYSVQRDEIMEIKSFADPARHGNRGLGSGISDVERARVFRLTWAIINRFIAAERPAA